MQAPVRREIHPQIKILDEANGLVEYVASDESVDCYREVIMAGGWRFDLFQKNAPFADSHNYNSIDNLLGRVVDFKVEGRKLVETVKWAIDVPLNTLAQKGFAMTVANYLRAVSVGFFPEKIVTKFDNDVSDFDAAMEQLDLGNDVAETVRCIYIQQQQTELSACLIGANPNALARAYTDGILDDKDLARWPEFRRAVESESANKGRTYSFGPFPTTPKPATPRLLSEIFGRSN